MTTLNNPASGSRIISAEYAESLVDRLYEIEALSFTMQKVLDSIPEEMTPDYALRVIAALRKELHLTFEDCARIISDAKLLYPPRQSTATPESEMSA